MVSLILISHSRTLAEGVRELAQQMAPEARIVAVGGSADGGIGTDFDRVLAALVEATSDAEGAALALMDLGSAVLTAETALDFLDAGAKPRVALSDAPLVEGALAAAVVAAAGSDLAAVAAAAAEARAMHKVEASADATTLAPAAPEGELFRREVTLLNPAGLHARPAAQIVRTLAGLDAGVTLRRADGKSAPAQSIVGLLGLSARQGETLVVEAQGAQAEVALEQLVALFAEGFGEMDAAPAPPEVAAPPTDVGEGVLRGYPTSAGIAIGPAFRLDAWEPPTAAAPPDDPAAEQQRLNEALAATRIALQREAAASRADSRAILDAQALLLDDPLLRDAAAERVATQGAVQAWWGAATAHAEALRQSGDPLIAARASDLLEVGRRVARALLGDTEASLMAPAGSIILADELGPAEMGALHRSGVAALALAGSGPTAHAAILARAFALPAVTGLGVALATIEAGTQLLLDGGAGTVRIAPSDAEVAKAEAARNAAEAQRAAQREAAQQPAITRDGRRIIVAANVASVAEAEAAVANGAEGVGLLRTEFLFLDRPTMPTEEAQAAALRAIFAPLGQRPIIVRTMDIGGDKPAAALDLDPVTHGFLGLRGLRYCLAHPALFHTHLRALLRAAEGYRVSVMFPMVATVDEVRRARAALDEAKTSLDGEGVPRGDMEEVGVMIEVPAAALAADELAAEVDFFSVGSNDLVQYTMAAERTNQEVAYLYQPTHVAIQRLLARTVDGARQHGRWVGVCGEMAGDPSLTAMLVGLGITELSMAPAAIPAVKAAVRTIF